MSEKVFEIQKLHLKIKYLNISLKFCIQDHLKEKIC